MEVGARRWILRHKSRYYGMQQARKLFNGINMKGCITRMSLATVAVLLESLPSPAAEVPTQERVRKLTRGAFFTRLGSPGMTA